MVKIELKEPLFIQICAKFPYI